MTLRGSCWLSLAVLAGGLTLAAQAKAADDLPQPGIDELAWMAGAWVQTSGETQTEEHWLAPKGGLMLGVSRTTRGTRTSFEFLRIASTDTGLVYFASPQGRPATELRLTSLQGERAVFENPERDFPRQISYWLDEQGALRARVEGTLRGEKRDLDFHWQRAK